MFQVDKSYLKSGTNIIAVEIHQNSSTSSDVKFDLEMKGTQVNESADVEYRDNPLTLNPGSDVSIRAVTEPEQQNLDLSINEIMASNIGSVFDEYGNDSDWIEIYNMSETQLDMAGLYLTDNLDKPTKWMIPLGDPGKTTIPSKGYLIFYADQNPILGSRHLNFKLDDMGESVGLSYLSGTSVIWIDSLTFSEQYPNVSTGYFPDGSGDWVNLNHTAGAKNAEAIVSIQAHQVLEVKLFPNPASDQLNVSISSPDGSLDDQMDIHIYDLTGRRILSEQHTVWGGVFNNRIDISALPEAIYVLVIETPSGAHSFRFVKTSR